MQTNNFSVMTQEVYWENPPNCTILESWVLDNFILTDELLAKVLKLLYELAIVYVEN